MTNEFEYLDVRPKSKLKTLAVGEALREYKAKSKERRILGGITEKIKKQDRYERIREAKEYQAQRKSQILQRQHKFQTASPIRSMFDSRGTALARRGYSRKAIAQAGARYRAGEQKRARAGRNFNRNTSSVVGWGF